jgi:hypothetical protein
MLSIYFACEKWVKEHFQFCHRMSDVTTNRRKKMKIDVKAVEWQFQLATKEKQVYAFEGLSPHSSSY